MILIAEIGNCHLGDFEKAKEMIKVAKDCGADIVKSQAFMAEDLNGNMPFAFYKKCQFQLEQYLELTHYARTYVGIELFYSIYSKRLYPMSYHFKYQKIPSAVTKRKPSTAEKMDLENCFVSVPELCARPKLDKAQVLYASDYRVSNPYLENIDNLREYYKRPVGYSDHTRGIDACIKAVKHHSAHVIEKHFTLDRDINFEGIQYDDAVHAALPKEFEELAHAVK